MFNDLFMQYLLEVRYVHVFIEMTKIITE